MQNLRAQLQEALTFVHSKTDLKPTVALILGSGLRSFADELTDKTEISTATIPHYPISTVEGHAGSMSTVPEVISAVFRGLNVLGISCITNLGTGMTQNRLSREEVAELVKNKFKNLIKEIIAKIR